MASIKQQPPTQATKAFIEKIVANANITQSYQNNNGIFTGVKKKYSLDHSTATNKENISIKNLNYFISPRSSSEQIFKNIKNLTSLAKNKTMVSPKPLLNNSNSIIKDVSQDKENFFLKYLKESNESNKIKPITNNCEDPQKKDKNTAEIIESLESLKNKYKTLKEMNFLKCNKNSEMICPSKFSKVALNNPSNKIRTTMNLHEENNKNIENSTNNTLNENSKKSNGTKKNTSGNMSNILSTNSNSESEIQQKSNEKDLKKPEVYDKNALTDVFQKNMAIYKFNKDRVKKIFQNFTQKNNGTPLNAVFSRNFSIPENNFHVLEGKKQISRRNSFHCESEKKQIVVSDNLMNILKKTKKMMGCYKMKEMVWKNEKKELHSQIDDLKRRLSQYELL